MLASSGAARGVRGECRCRGRSGHVGNAARRVAPRSGRVGACARRLPRERVDATDLRRATSCSIGERCAAACRPAVRRGRRAGGSRPHGPGARVAGTRNGSYRIGGRLESLSQGERCVRRTRRVVRQRTHRHELPRSHLRRRPEGRRTRRRGSLRGARVDLSQDEAVHHTSWSGQKCSRHVLPRQPGSRGGLSVDGRSGAELRRGPGDDWWTRRVLEAADRRTSNTPRGHRR